MWNLHPVPVGPGYSPCTHLEFALNWKKPHVLDVMGLSDMCSELHRSFVSTAVRACSLCGGVHLTSCSRASGGMTRQRAEVTWGEGAFNDDFNDCYLGTFRGTGTSYVYWCIMEAIRCVVEKEAFLLMR